jgi:hypothetical protein
VLGGCSLGCGLIVEFASGRRLPAGLKLPTGFAAVVVLSAFPPLFGSTARLGAPVILGLAAVGFGLALVFRAETPRIDLWAAAAAAGAYLSYAAPTVLSGRATFDGYIKLDDTATYLAMVDRVATRGHDLTGLAPSTYEATLNTSLAFGYPVGSFAPLGDVQQLLGIDTAWLWQPYLSFMGALLALGLYGLAAPLVPSRPLRAAFALVAAQPAILFGYALWGGIKELATALLVAVLATLVPPLLERGSVRAAIPLAVAAAALVDVLSLGGAAWLVLLAPAIVLVAVVRGLGFAARAAVVFAAATALLAVPAIVSAIKWLPNAGAFTSEGELANLVRPLRWIQIAGVWFAPDFRRSPADFAPTAVLIGVVLAAAVAGLAWAVYRRAWGVAIYAAGALVASLVLFVVGSPWIAGKALASASPAVLLLALVAAASLVVAGRRVEGAVLAAVIVGGVGWSNALGYREVWLAPNDRLTELEHAGERYAGAGPALMTEFEPYGARHFLRRLDPEGTSELRRSVIPLLSGAPLEPQQYADLDAFQLGGTLIYRTLVLRRSPVASRPSAPYRPVGRGRWYEVWQRADPPAPQVLQHLPLGTPLDPAAVPNCDDVLRLTALTGVQRLAAVPRAPVTTVSLDRLRHPAAWTVGYLPGTLNPVGSGDVVARVRVARAGRYRIWVGGSFVGEVEALVDGHVTGTARHQLEWTGQFVDLGAARLGPGTHTVTLRYVAGGWRPGSHGNAPFPFGPLAVAQDDPRRVITVPLSRAASLCGRRLDWVEALGSP